MGLILLAFTALCGMSLVQKSVTVDEFAHLPAGLSYWRTGDFRIYAHGSPLIHLLAAVPLLASDAALPLEVGWKNRHQWQFGLEFMAANAAHYQSLFLRARAVIVALGALLVVLVWWWARALYGAEAGLAAAALATFNPNLMAHSRLVTNDVGVTLFFLAAVAVFWRFCRRPTWPRLLAAGLVLGLALLSKFTALLLLPLLPALGLADRGLGGTGLSGRRLGLTLPLLFIVAWVTLCSGYLWQGFGTRLGDYSFQSALFQKTASLLPSSLRVPLPFDCVQGLDFLSYSNQNLYPSYLLGKTGPAAWYYFPVALIVKTPLSALFLIALGIGSVLLRRRFALRDEIFLLLPPFFLLAFISFYSKMDLGIRYILPAFPFLFILAARPFSRIGQARRFFQAGLLLLLAGNVASNLWIFPDYLAYFNCAAGGPSRGYRVLIDSNLDWGQDLIGLKRYLDEKGVDQVCLAYFGRVDPGIYGIDYTLPQPGKKCELIAISVNLLMGMQEMLMDGARPVWTKPGQFDWLKTQTPVTTIGHSIWIFKPEPAGPPPPPAAGSPGSP